MWFMPMATELIKRDSMSQSALDRLVKMVNQIALNMGANGSDVTVADQVAQHLQKFWSPAMKNLIMPSCCRLPWPSGKESALMY